MGNKPRTHPPPLHTNNNNSSRQPHTMQTQAASKPQLSSDQATSAASIDTYSSSHPDQQKQKQKQKQQQYDPNSSYVQNTSTDKLPRPLHPEAQSQQSQQHDRSISSGNNAVHHHNATPLISPIDDGYNHHYQQYGQQHDQQYDQQYNQQYDQQYDQQYNQQYDQQYDQQYNQQYNQQYDQQYSQQYGQQYDQQYNQQYDQQYDQQYQQRQDDKSALQSSGHTLADSVYGNPFVDPTPFTSSGHAMHPLQRNYSTNGGYSDYQPGDATSGAVQYSVYSVQEQEPIAYAAAPLKSFVPPAVVSKAKPFHVASNSSPYNADSNQSSSGHLDNYRVYSNTPFSEYTANPLPSSSTKVSRSSSRRQATAVVSPNRLAASTGTHGSSTSLNKGLNVGFINARNSESKNGKKQYYLCCFPTKLALWICLGITAFLLAILGVVGYLYFPRNPDMQLISITPIKNTNTLSAGPKGFGLVVELKMLMNVSAINNNRYPLVINHMDMVGKVGSGSRTAPITFPPKEPMFFTIEFDISYATQEVLTDDPILAELLQGCGFLNSPARPMVIHYKADVVVGVLSSMGYKPSFENDFKINCPSDIGKTLGKFDFLDLGIKAKTPAKFVSVDSGDSITTAPSGKSSTSSKRKRDGKD
ncbi:hypothetical protein BASA61_004984 [Batrachochytrium salamandrivorans]|nr:hypothetical protein BASA61_004984 [Batrachochytrium salamandrivorans]